MTLHGVKVPQTSRLSQALERVPGSALFYPEAGGMTLWCVVGRSGARGWMREPTTPKEPML
jgi:hypothetical protein